MPWRKPSAHPERARQRIVRGARDARLSGKGSAVPGVPPYVAGTKRRLAHAPAPVCYDHREQREEVLKRTVVPNWSAGKHAHL